MDRRPFDPIPAPSASAGVPAWSRTPEHDRRIGRGDDFAGDYSIDAVVQTIDRRNRVQADGTRRVRIHGVGFPRGFRGGGQIPRTASRFATLMRVLCDRNGGTFVALTDANR